MACLLLLQYFIFALLWRSVLVSATPIPSYFRQIKLHDFTCWQKWYHKQWINSWTKFFGKDVRSIARNTFYRKLQWLSKFRSIFAYEFFCAFPLTQSHARITYNAIIHSLWTPFQLVVFKPLSYCFEETKGFDVKT